MVRHKNRYMVVEINPLDRKSTAPLHLKPSSLHQVIMKEIQQLHGDFGVAAVTAGFSANYCNEQTRIAIFKTRHGPHRLLASVVPCIKSIENQRVAIVALFTGATIRQCFKFVLTYQQQQLDKLSVLLTTEKERNELKDNLMKLDRILKMN